MMKWLNKLLGNTSEREVNRLWPTVEQISALEPEFESLSDSALRDKTIEFRGRHLASEALDDLLPEAFAAVREAAKRTIGQRHFDVQLLAGIVLHQGRIAEMKTGEGKTLVATLPLYLNALTAEGCHLVTPNDYLSRVGGGWMGPVYDALGLTVGVISHEFAGIYDPDFQDPTPHGDDRLDHWRPVPRPEAYLADITYGTNNEFGFDYLRDNMVIDLSQMAQREHHFAIVDEVDNILIDEARTPLIISGQAEESADKYFLFSKLVPRLVRERDFKIDEKLRLVTLTEDGIEAIERALKVDNLYDPANFEMTHYLEQALKAQFIFRRDRDYVLYHQGNVLDPHQNHPQAEIVIVDEFTGRLMIGRRYSEGLHQSIEAKENVKIQRENQTLATITFQNYFRMYKKLAGMTGTAETEREEFLTIYNLEVVVIPTHRPMVREDDPDLVYKSERGKFNAVVDEIEEKVKEGRPILVGTVSIEKSEQLTDFLQKRRIKFQVLNAKYHEQEALIVAQAGRPGAVTIATNMAGRGVDILLGGNPTGLVDELLRAKGKRLETATDEERAAARDEAEKIVADDRERVRELGGLHIIGTERHEARRIDNQLRGRSGRQGDTGSSRFYLSLEDDLMRRFGGPSISGLMERFGLDESTPIEHNLVSRVIENAQTKVEGHNFDIRKHVVQYDDVMNQQREVIYGERRKVLTHENLKEVILDIVRQQVAETVTSLTSERDMDEWDLDGLAQALRGFLPLPAEFGAEDLQGFSQSELIERLQAMAEDIYAAKEEELGAEMKFAERFVMLNVIDRLWIQHLTALDELREGIGLRAYGQRDPLVEYKSEAFAMFQALEANIQSEIAQTVFRLTLRRREVAPAPPREVRTNRDDEAPTKSPVRSARKVGRNDPCPCGSGKKYKKCHGAGSAVQRAS
jgi:preprotein translocase subunit SecA